MVTHHVKVSSSQKFRYLKRSNSRGKSPPWPPISAALIPRRARWSSIASLITHAVPRGDQSRNQSPTHARRRWRIRAQRARRCLACPAAQRFDCEWAAWANGVAVRELDMHDTFLAADYSHPGDNIPPLLAVAQQCGCTGADLLRGLLVAYEIQMDLVRGICLHEYKKDHIAHLCPSAAAGIGAMLGLDTDTIYQAVQQAVHVGFSTRQSRKGEISSWKAYAPAHAGKLAIEAVDRAMRGEKSPSPIYEGEDSVIAWMLGGRRRQLRSSAARAGRTVPRHS